MEWLASVLTTKGSMFFGRTLGRATPDGGHFCGGKARYKFGVIEEEKEWCSEDPKRHQHKHLGFDPATFRDQGVGARNSSPIFSALILRLKEFANSVILGFMPRSTQHIG
jgi:hypothetical protein